MPTGSVLWGLGIAFVVGVLVGLVGGDWAWNATFGRRESDDAKE